MQMWSSTVEIKSDSGLEMRLVIYVLDKYQHTYHINTYDFEYNWAYGMSMHNHSEIFILN